VDQPSPEPVPEPAASSATRACKALHTASAAEPGAKASYALPGRVLVASNRVSVVAVRTHSPQGRLGCRDLGIDGYGQAVGPLPSQPRRLNIISSKMIAASSEPMPRNRK
jgi:hypothetical protein